MKKLIVIILILAILLQSFMCVYAGAASEEYAGGGIGSYTDFKETEILDFEETQVDFPERMAASLFMALPNFLVNALGLQDLIPLVYMKAPPQSAAEQSQQESGSYYGGGVSGYTEKPKKITHLPENLINGIWTVNENDMLKTVQNKMKSELASVIFIAIAVTGFIMIWKGTSSESIDYFKSLGTGIVILIVMLKFTPYIFTFVFKINKLLIDMAWDLLNPNEQSTNFLDMLWRPGTKSLGMALVSTLAVFMIGTMNFQYAVRRLMLGVLFILTPVVGYVSMFPSRKDALNLWTSEFIGNVFIQTAHALTLTLYIKWLTVNPSFWIAIAGLMSLNSIAMLVRSALGLSKFEGKTAGSMMGNALGLGAMLAVPRLIGAVSGRKGKATAGSTLSGGITETATTTAKKAVGSTATAGKTLTGLATDAANTELSLPRSPLREFTQQARIKGLKTSGGVALGTTGMLAGGLALSAMGQGPTAGVAIGGAVGARTGAKTGETTGKAINQYKNFKDEFKMSGFESRKDYINDKIGFYDESQLSDVQQMIDLGGRRASAVYGDVFGENTSKMGQVMGEIKGKKHEKKAIQAKHGATQEIRSVQNLGGNYDYDNSELVKTGVEHEATLENTRHLNEINKIVVNSKTELDKEIELLNIEKSKVQQSKLLHGENSQEYSNALSAYNQQEEIKLDKEIEHMEYKLLLEKEQSKAETMDRLQRMKQDLTRKVKADNGFDGSWATL